MSDAARLTHIADSLVEAAVSIDNDGTPSQVGLTSEECRSFATELRAMAAPTNTIVGDPVALDAVKAAIRKGLTDNLQNLGTLDRFDCDVLLRGCQHALHSRGYEKPTEAADILATEAAKLVMALYASPGTTSRDSVLENGFAEYGGVTAKELAETVARYGKALRELATNPLVTDGWVQEHAIRALQAKL